MTLAAVGLLGALAVGFVSWLALIVGFALLWWGVQSL